MRAQARTRAEKRIQGWWQNINSHQTSEILFKLDLYGDGLNVVN